MSRLLINAMSALQITIIDIASILEVPVSEAIKLIDGELSNIQAEKIRDVYFKNWKLDDLLRMNRRLF